MHLYNIFNWRLCPFFFSNFCNLVLKLQTEQSMVPASHNYLPFFTRTILKGLTFGLCFTFVKCACFCIVFNMCKIWFSEKPWGDLVRLTGPVRLQKINQGIVFITSHAHSLNGGLWDISQWVTCGYGAAGETWKCLNGLSEIWVQQYRAAPQNVWCWHFFYN